jgi:ketosteroid isomerase-like protein
MADLEPIAERIAKVIDSGQFLEGTGLEGLFSDEVEVRHFPAVPQDGVRSRADFEAGLKAASGRIAETKGRLVVDGAVTIHEETVSIEVAHEGELPSGPYRFAFLMAFVVANGKIVRVEEHFGEEALAEQAKVRAASR